jgi:hypothetical protein
MKYFKCGKDVIGGNEPKWFQVLADAHPEHGQAIETETDAEVVHDADV